MGYITYGYWFYFGIFFAALGLLLFFVTRKKRTNRNIHTIVLMALLAFSGFKCAREEVVNEKLKQEGPYTFTIAKIVNAKAFSDSDKIEQIEYKYSIGEQHYGGIDKLLTAYTNERDFTEDDIYDKCVLIRVVASKLSVSSLVGILKKCEPAPQNGTANPNYELDDLWIR